MINVMPPARLMMNVTYSYECSLWKPYRFHKLEFGDDQRWDAPDGKGLIEHADDLPPDISCSNIAHLMKMMMHILTPSQKAKIRELAKFKPLDDVYTISPDGEITERFCRR